MTRQLKRKAFHLINVYPIKSPLSIFRLGCVCCRCVLLLMKRHLSWSGCVAADSLVREPFLPLYYLSQKIVCLLISFSTSLCFELCAFSVKCCCLVSVTPLLHLNQPSWLLQSVVGKKPQSWSGCVYNILA